MRKAGIYKIINKTTGKFYIGSSLDIPQRWSSHRSELRRNIHQNSYLQNAWNKYGEENFEFIIFEECEKKRETTLLREQHWLDELKPYDRNIGYNLCITATGSMANKGRKFTEAHKEKISKALKGKEKSEEHCKNLSEAMKGKMQGENNPFYGKQHSEESKRKMSENHADMSGENNPFYGKKHTKEAKKKMRKKLDEEKVKQIRTRYATGEYSQSGLGKMFGVTQRTIRLVILREIWTDV